MYFRTARLCRSRFGEGIDKKKALALSLLQQSPPFHVRPFSATPYHTRGLSSTSEQPSKLEYHFPDEHFSLETPRRSQGVAVMKMGGSSLGNGDAISRSSYIMHDFYKKHEGPVVVVSALYGITNKLVDVCHVAASGDEKRVHDLRSRIRGFHLEQADALLSEFPELLSHTQEEMERILETFFDPAVNATLSSREIIPTHYDSISTVGERLCVPLISSVLGSLGVPTVEVTTEDLIIKEGPSDNDAVRYEESRHRVRHHLLPILHQGHLPVVTGFIAGTPEYKTCTLGRGGSDLSATLIAYALNAQEVHLWKVEGEDREDGFMKNWKEIRSQFLWTGIRSADPTKVKAAQIVERLSYDDATELTFFGKKVLHREAMMPCKLANIPIYVRNTARPLHPGTKIESMKPASESSSSSAPFLDSKSDTKNLVVVALPLNKFEQLNKNVKNLVSEELKAKMSADGLKLEETVVLSLVGESSVEMRKSFETILTASDSGLSRVYIISDFKFSASVAAIVHKADEARATNLLHAGFIPAVKRLRRTVNAIVPPKRERPVIPKPPTRPLFSF